MIYLVKKLKNTVSKMEYMDGLRVVEISKDGNCLFNAISGQINGDIHGGRQQGIRNQLKAYIVENMDEFPTIREMLEERYELMREKGLDRAKLVKNGSLKEYYELTVPRKFGGNIAITAATRRYQMNVIVHPINEIQVPIPFDMPYDRTMHLRYNRALRHYDLLEDPKPQWKYNNNLDPEWNLNEVDLRPTSDDDFYQWCVERGFDMDRETDDEEEEDKRDEKKEKKKNDDDKIGSSDDEDSFKDNPRLKHLLESSLFLYLAKNIFHAGRSTADILILVPNDVKYSSLSEIIEKGKPNSILIIISYSSGTKSDVLTDASLIETFRVFSRRVTMPAKKSMQERIRWLGSLIVTPLLLSALQFRCEGIRVFSALKFSDQALANIIIDSCWNHVGDEIMDDVKNIMEDPGIFWDHHCGRSCQYKDYSWHLRLKEFTELEFREAEKFDFFTRYYLFDRKNTNISEALGEIREFYWDKTKTTVDQLEQMLNDRAEKNKSEKYFTYLALIIDGPGMENFQEAPVNDLLENSDLQNALYGGYAKNKKFRQGHFEGSSAIYEVLTQTSRLFLIRSHEENTQPKALKDEAMMIETLKGCLYLNHINAETPPFVLLNKKSESCRLLHLTESEIIGLLNFCESRIPVFVPEGFIPEPTKTFRGRFTGNYQTYEEIPIPRERFKDKAFKDVQKHYENLLFKVHN